MCIEDWAFYCFLFLFLLFCCLGKAVTSPGIWDICLLASKITKILQFRTGYVAWGIVHNTELLSLTRKNARSAALWNPLCLPRDRKFLDAPHLDTTIG